MNFQALFKGILVLTWLVGAVFAGFPGNARAQSDAPTVIVLNARASVAPALQLYLERGLQLAVDQKAEAVVIALNTPGGSLDSMNLIVEKIRACSVPVVVYVSPRGAWAASAGTIITLAGHVAAMAPETTIGAASPVGGEGQDIGETMEQKVKEVMKATVRNLAQNRPPAAIALAEETIESARAVTGEEALKVGLVDLTATDLPDLLSKLEGRKVNVLGNEVTLRTQGARVEEVPSTLLEEALQLLTNPNLVFLFLSLGVMALLTEFSSPGGWVAGFVGVVLMLLSFFGMGVLPVNWFGLLFLALAFLLFILDIKAPTHGALTAAGAASFIAGGLILFNSFRLPGFPAISVPFVVGTGVFLALFFFVVVSIGLRAQRAPVLMGRPSLVGKRGYVRGGLNPEGQVQLGGELWSAVLEDERGSLPENAAVEVVSVSGVRLTVRKAP